MKQRVNSAKVYLMFICVEMTICDEAFRFLSNMTNSRMFSQLVQANLSPSGAMLHVTVANYCRDCRLVRKNGRVEREVRETDTKAIEEEKIHILVTNWFLE